MRYVFYIACFALAIYAVGKIDGHEYVRQAQKENIPLDYFQSNDTQ